MTAEDVVLEISNNIATVGFGQGRLNLLTQKTLEELRDTLSSLEGRDDVRCVVLKGQDPANFSAGMNLNEEREHIADGDETVRELGSEIVRLLERLPIATVSAIRGWCIGGPLTFALACDVRLASEQARFRQTDAYMGMFGGWGLAGARIVHYVGRNRALDYILLGEELSSHEAKDMGLISRVIPEEGFFDAAYAVAARIAQAGPLSVAAFKASLYAQYSDAVLAGEAVEAEWVARVGGSRDLSEGISAVLEKRPARFEGR